MCNKVKSSQCYRALDSTVCTYFLRQIDDESLACVVGHAGAEVFTAGGKNRAMSPETAVLYHHRHITQEVLLPLLIQTA